jgi:hypothetical protein
MFLHSFQTALDLSSLHDFHSLSSPFVYTVAPDLSRLHIHPSPPPDSMTEILFYHTATSSRFCWKIFPEKKPTHPSVTPTKQVTVTPTRQYD